MHCGSRIQASRDFSRRLRSGRAGRLSAVSRHTRGGGLAMRVWFVLTLQSGGLARGAPARCTRSVSAAAPHDSPVVRHARCVWPSMLRRSRAPSVHVVGGAPLRDITVSESPFVSESLFAALPAEEGDSGLCTTGLPHTCWALLVLPVLSLRESPHTTVRVPTERPPADRAPTC